VSLEKETAMEDGICQECHERPAVVHVSQLSNSEYVSLDLCTECARKKGVLTASTAVAVTFQGTQSLSDVFQDLLKNESAFQEEAGDRVLCPGCQRSYVDFRESGRLGCAQCYKTFGAQLSGLINSVQQASQHYGKVAMKSNDVFTKHLRLQKYKLRLRTAVGNEEFEEAARLRDQIRELETPIT